MSIKPIQTRYAGHRFRSRLEARWAVVLDHLNVKWLYEHEGFETEHGRYLPDFWLPDYNTYLEIKGGTATKEEKLKLYSLIRDKKCFGAFGYSLDSQVDQWYLAPHLSNTAPISPWRFHRNAWGHDAPAPRWPLKLLNPLGPKGRTYTGRGFGEPLTCPYCGAANIDRDRLHSTAGSFALFSNECHHRWRFELITFDGSLSAALRLYDYENVDPFEYHLRLPESQAAIDAGRTARFEHGESPR